MFELFNYIFIKFYMFLIFWEVKPHFMLCIFCILAKKGAFDLVTPQVRDMKRLVEEADSLVQDIFYKVSSRSRPLWSHASKPKMQQTRILNRTLFGDSS